jgi:O-antigen/teichoic acid export membrane protein
VSRLTRAAVMAAFSYAQFGLAIITGIVLVPLMLHELGAREYGLWLASGELVGYAAIIDLGVLGVLPWMLAEADGCGDRLAMQRLLTNGLLVGAIIGLAYAAIVGVLWMLLPSMLHLSAADRALLTRPLMIVVAATMIGYPFRAFSAVLSGMQDVVFNGILTTAELVAGVAITVVMLLRGNGLYALAVAFAAPALVVNVASAIRVACIAPHLLTGWTRPTMGGVRHLLTNGIGVWFGMFGWQLIAASNNMVIACLGHPEWVPIYACTSKASAMCAQIAWVLPDSGLIGLAQLHGEPQSRARIGPVINAMLRLHLLLAGGAACVVLAFNPAFVTRWVGAGFFGGLTLNALLAAGIISASLVHGLVAAASVLGNRLKVGIVTLATGGAQLVCAVALGYAFGLVGIAAAALATALLMSAPAGVVLLQPAVSLGFGVLLRDLLGPWLLRLAPLAAFAAATGAAGAMLGIWIAGPIAGVIGLVYLWQMRSSFEHLPLDPRWERWLISLRLLPKLATAPVEPL